MSREIPLMREFLAAYRHPLVRLFRRNIFNKTMQDINTGKVHQVKAAIKGQADVYGYIKGMQSPNVISGAFHRHAVPFEIEFKAEKTRVSDEQENWRNFCREWGIPHLILRAQPGDGPVFTVHRWTEELNKLVQSLL